MIQKLIRYSFTNAQLKYWAVLTMLIDHIGAVLIEGTALYEIRGFYILNIILRLIGRIAFPIFCFLLVEGFEHTKSRKHYMFRMLIFAFLSELPFDLAVFGQLEFSHQNVFFTLFLALVMLSLLERCTKKTQVVFVVFLFSILAEVLHSDYSYLGILLIAILYLLREKDQLKCIYGGLLFSFEITSVISFMMIYHFSGEKGNLRAPKLFFYLFYLLHLTILAILKYALLI